MTSSLFEAVTAALRDAPAAGCRRLAPTRPCVHPERILRIQGYSDLGRVRPVIRKAAAAMAQAAESLSTPAVAYRHVRIQALHDDGALLLDGGGRLSCPAFPRQLAGCTEVTPFVLTLGSASPQRVIELVEAGDLLEGLLLETAGWLASEDATRQFKSHLREAVAARGQRITSRMGPGYSYKVGGRMVMWPLEEQPALFALLPGELPVSLMGSCAMNPKMSRSGLYGVAPTVSPETSCKPNSRGAAR